MSFLFSKGSGETVENGRSPEGPRQEDVICSWKSDEAPPVQHCDVDVKISSTFFKIKFLLSLKFG